MTPEQQETLKWAASRLIDYALELRPLGHEMDARSIERLAAALRAMAEEKEG